MGRHLKHLGAAFREVFAYPLYIILASVLMIVAFLSAVWLPNIGLLADLLSGSTAPLTAKLGIALSLLGGIATNFTLLSAAYTVAIAVLFGITASMIVYLLKRRRLGAAGKNIVLGSGAMASGVVGIGCAACGSLILGGVIPFFGAAGALALLPLNGAEFGILSVLLLFVSLLLVSRNIAEPASCPRVQSENAKRP